MGFYLSSVRWCGTRPYLLSKETCLENRGFLVPPVMDGLYILAADPRATVSRVAGFGSHRLEVVSNGVIVVLGDFANIGLPILITAYVSGDPQFPAGAVLAAAAKVDIASLVDLDERLRGAA